jgi:anti-sigma factor RsiW
MKPPTDLEWMMFHDGELEPSRQAELQALLDGDEQAAAKLRGMNALGVFVRETAGKAQLPDLSDAIMKGVADFDQAEAKLEARPKLSTKPAETAKPAQVLSLTPKSPAKSASAANDNGRLLFGLTGLAAAAAVALFVWGRSATDAPLAQVPSEPRVAADEVAAAEPAAPTLAAAPSKPVQQQEEDRGLPPVEVASVDFGSRIGAVYYVDEPRGGATTTVVWLADD